LPELPHAKYRRFMQQYGLNSYNASRLTEEQALAAYFERAAESAPPQAVANMILGDLLSLINESAADGAAGDAFSQPRVPPEALAGLVRIIAEGQINLTQARDVLAAMYTSGADAESIVQSRGLRQVSDLSEISVLVADTLRENPREVASYKAGKTAVANFLFGQVMQKTAGKANPQVVRTELNRQLSQ
jgi:aspartyl-tRNA(Asn)/glutamyl-tRNA(Gln) amidotransferase subunit B